MSKLVHRCELCPWRRDQKRQRKKPNSGKLSIHRDHPRRRIEMEFCMVGGLQMIVLMFEFHQNRLSGVGVGGVKICPCPLTWLLAYTTVTSCDVTRQSCSLLHPIIGLWLNQQNEIWTVFGRLFVKRFALCYRTVVCPVLSVCLSLCL